MAPDTPSAIVRCSAGLTPTESAAAGFSPQARMRRPRPVRNINHHVSGTRATTSSVSTLTSVTRPSVTRATSDMIGIDAAATGSSSAWAPGRLTVGSASTVGDWVIVPPSMPSKKIEDRNRARPAASRLSASPATAWSIRKTTASTASAIPNDIPAATPARIPPTGPAW